MSVSTAPKSLPQVSPRLVVGGFGRVGGCVMVEVVGAARPHVERSRRLSTSWECNGAEDGRSERRGRD
jgi:hypothetical protein